MSLRREGKPRQEEQLVDFARRLRKHCAGRMAVHVHISRLGPENRAPHALRQSAACFHSLLKRDAGQLFRLGNADLVFASKDASALDVESAVIALRGLYRHDSALAGDESPDPRHDALVDWYELDSDYEAFLADCEALLAAARQAMDAPPQEQPGPAPTADCRDDKPADKYALHSSADQRPGATITYHAIHAPEPMKPPVPAPVPTPTQIMAAADLDRLESSLRTLDATSFIEPRPVVAIAGSDTPPHPVFAEQHFSYSALQNAVLPSRDLKASPCLFEYLARLIELRLLRTLKLSGGGKALAFSFPSHVDAVLSEVFLRFDAERRRLTDRPIIIEFRLPDVMRSAYRYMEARARLHALGYRVCLQGMSAFDFVFLNRRQVIADFEKIEWRDDYETTLAGAWRQHFADSAALAGRGRLILSGCTSAQAVETGRALGFCLFQGPYVSGLVSRDDPSRMAI